MTILPLICDKSTPKRPFYVNLYCQIASIIVEYWITSWPRIVYYQHRQTLHAPGGQVVGTEEEQKRTSKPCLRIQISTDAWILPQSLSWMWGQTCWLAHSCVFLGLKGWGGEQSGRCFVCQYKVLQVSFDISGSPILLWSDTIQLYYHLTLHCIKRSSFCTIDELSSCSSFS